MEAAYAARQGGLGRFASPRLLRALGDEGLVEHLRRGNESAFEVLYDRHHRNILSYCRHMLGSREEAEDAVQQTFLSAYRALLDSDKPVQFKPWAFTIARNRCFTMLRSRREQPGGDLVEPVTAGLAEEVQERADLRELLRDMGELPERQRSALVLTELGALSHHDVAEVVGCEVDQVKSLVFQARTALMDKRRAREIPCADIREQLATASGGALRRGPLRRHLRGCPGCREFRDEVREQRKMLAVVLPVIPTLGLRESALAAVGIGGGAGGAGLGGGGLGAGLVANAGGAKVAAVAVLAGTAAVGGGVVATRGDGSPAKGDRPAQSADAPRNEAAGGGGPNSGLVAGSAGDTDDREAADREKAKGNRAERRREAAEKRRERRAKAKLERRRAARDGNGDGDGGNSNGNGHGHGGNPDPGGKGTGDNSNGNGYGQGGNPDPAGKGVNNNSQGKGYGRGGNPDPGGSSPHADSGTDLPELDDQNGRGRALGRHKLELED